MNCQTGDSALAPLGLMVYQPAFRFSEKSDFDTERFSRDSHRAT
jgi:hypothetical protein